MPKAASPCGPWHSERSSSRKRPLEEETQLVPCGPWDSERSSSRKRPLEEETQLVPYTEEDKDSKITKLMVERFMLQARGPDKCIVPRTVIELLEHLKKPGQCFVAVQSGIMNIIHDFDNCQGPTGREILRVLMEDPRTADLLCQSDPDIYHQVLYSRSLINASNTSTKSDNSGTEKASMLTTVNSISCSRHHPWLQDSSDGGTKVKEVKTFKILQTTQIYTAQHRNAKGSSQVPAGVQVQGSTFNLDSDVWLLLACTESESGYLLEDCSQTGKVFKEVVSYGARPTASRPVIEQAKQYLQPPSGACGASGSARGGNVAMPKTTRTLAAYSTDCAEPQTLCNGKLTLGDRASPAVDNAIVSFLWAEEIDDDSDQVDEDAANEHYQKIRGHIADALTLGLSLATCKAKRILMISPNVRNICGAELLSLYWELREVEPVVVHESWFSRCERRFRGTFTKLRAVELVEFRKVMIMDLDMIVLKVRDIDSLFGYETPAACHRGNREERVAWPRQFDAQPIQNGRMIGGINAGLMLIKPSKSDFSQMERELAVATTQATSGPEQDYLSRFYPQWLRIPVEYNFQLHQIQHLKKQFRAGQRPERRCRFQDIKVIHYSGDYSPRDWIFQDNGFDGFDSWVKGHLLPKYGEIHKVDNLTLMNCIEWWEKMWQRVKGQIIIYNCREDAKSTGCCGRPVACRPWVAEDMPLPEHEQLCETCARWPLPLRKADQEESSLGQPPQIGEHKGRGRGKRGDKRQCSYRNGVRPGSQQNYQATWQQPYQKQRVRSRTPHRQQVRRQSQASPHQEGYQNAAYRQQEHPPGINARVQQMQKPEQVVIGKRVTNNAPHQDTGCNVASTAYTPMRQPKLPWVRKSPWQAGYGTWR